MLKTKLCNLWASGGGCPNGASCTFAHGNEDLGTERKKEEKVCIEFVQGTCHRGANCRFQHRDPTDDEIKASPKLKDLPKLPKKGEGLQKGSKKGEVPQKG